MKTTSRRCASFVSFFRASALFAAFALFIVAAGAEQAKFVEGQILVKAKAGVALEKFHAKHKELGAETAHAYKHVGGLELVRLPKGKAVADVIAAYKASGLVEYAEPDYIVSINLTPNDPAYANGTLWGMNNTGQGGGTNDADIDAPEAWDVRTDASSIIVAVIDTGVRYTHEDLAANMWRNPGEIAGNSIDDDGNGLVDDVFGARYEGVTVTGNPMDDNSHGSHVAGTIGGVGNNGKGVVGVSWGAKIMALKFLSAGGSGSTSDAIKCVDYAISKGAKIMSNSWGGGDYSQSLYDAINRARVRGILFVAAAGNSGLNNDGSPFYPANYALDNVISVAATDRYDALASFSNYGVTTVDLGAPGVSIYSSVHNSDSAYGTKSGTSMATPHVSGACALVWAQFPAMSASEIKARILDTTDPLASLAGKTVSGGRLNVHKALTQDVPPTNEAPVVTITSPPDGSSFSNGAAITFTGNANDTEDGDLTASLVWTSNIDGVIGNGGSFTAVLSPGAHTVTAAVVDSGGRVGTDSITVTVVVPAPPAAPSNLTAIVSGSTVTLNWADNSNNETGFAIERRTKSKNAWTEFTQVGAVGANVRSFVNTSVPSGTHQYRVRAYNGVGNSAYSNSAQVKVR